MKHNFEERRQNRIDYAKKQAAKNEKLSDQLYNEASKMASAIPFGQPILVGHHSEKRDRNYRDKIHNKFGKAFEASDKAKYYERKAETIESNDAIFSDDPDALDKLRGQLNSLLDNQAFMKAANVCLRKKDKEGFMKLKGATKALWEEVNRPDCFNIRGYAPFALSNNNANIRRVKLRIAELEQFSQRPEQEYLFPGGRIVENKQAGRIQVIFDEKPSKEICKLVGSEGFHWSRREVAWMRHLNNNGVWAAKRLLQKLKDVMSNQQ